MQFRTSSPKQYYLILARSKKCLKTTFSTFVQLVKEGLQIYISQVTTNENTKHQTMTTKSSSKNPSKQTSHKCTQNIINKEKTPYIPI